MPIAIEIVSQLFAFAFKVDKFDDYSSNNLDLAVENDEKIGNI